MAFAAAHDGSMDYTLHSVTTALCPECVASVPAKILLKRGAVYLRKTCQTHGVSEVLLEEDAAFFLRQAEYDKPGTDSVRQTQTERGCPFDCGLCPDHEQHTCIGLLEITEACDLMCPVCYANAGGTGMMSLDEVGRILDAYQKAEHGHADVLQISGGEPTLHPQILDIVRLAREKRIRYVMLNTNGLRIAEEPEFARALSEFHKGFEIYLQFDGFLPETYRRLRGRDLSEVKLRAIGNLAAHNVPVTLVATVQAGINDTEIGRIVQFGMETPGIRGINFQPVALFGRTDGIRDALTPAPCTGGIYDALGPCDRTGGIYDAPAASPRTGGIYDAPAASRRTGGIHVALGPCERITRTGVIKRIEQQTGGMIRMDDFVPLPCDVDRVAFTLMYRRGAEFFPIARKADIRKYLGLIDNTMAFYAQDLLKEAAQAIVCGGRGCDCLSFLKDFVPLASLGARALAARDKPQFSTDNIFRVTVTSFLDKYNFEMKGMKKECVHVLTPDLRRIPFSAYNMIHREKRHALG